MRVWWLAILLLVCLVQRGCAQAEVRAKRAPAERVAKVERSVARVPISETELNDFACRYNEYVSKLRDGRVDLQAWDKVRRAWREIAGGTSQ